MNVVDLFCGCGGLSLGLQKSGFNIMCAIDNWEEALNVYRDNFSHDVKKMDLKDVLSASSEIQKYNPDMIVGGPPCQDFSSAGKRNEDNGRGDLTVCYAQIISIIRPKWFVMENVERILKTNKIVEAKSIFKNAGYGLTQVVLDASLCGVPQKRKRFVLIGHLCSEDDFLSETIVSNLSSKPMTVANYFGDKLDLKYYYRHPRSYARRGVFSVDEPSPTIRGVNRPMPKGYVLHPTDPVSSLDGIRALTSKERSMIQTFPESFVFNVNSKTNLEQMIGNAVPVNLGKFVGDCIKEYICKNGMPF